MSPSSHSLISAPTTHPTPMTPMTPVSQVPVGHVKRFVDRLVTAFVVFFPLLNDDLDRTCRRWQEAVQEEDHEECKHRERCLHFVLPVCLVYFLSAGMASESALLCSCHFFIYRYIAAIQRNNDDSCCKAWNLTGSDSKLTNVTNVFQFLGKRIGYPKTE